MVRDSALENDLNRNIANPFHISNFASLRQSAPVLYQQLANLGLFSSRVVRKNQLLRAFPHMTGLTQDQAPIGENKYNSLIVRLEHRFRYGLSLNTHYEWSHTMSRDWFANPFDEQPVWRESDFSRPHRWVVTGLYEPPFGKRKRFLSGSRWGSALAGGWQVGTALQRQSGECIDFPNLFWYGNDYRDIVLPKDQRNAGPLVQHRPVRAQLQ